MSRSILTDAYRIGGVTVTFRVADPALRRIIRTTWSAFRVAVSGRRVDASFRFEDRPGQVLRGLKSWHTFITDHAIVLSDGCRYLMTGLLDGRSWQFDGRALPDWDPTFVYYYVCEPLLFDVLKRHGVLVWHSAAVERGGLAILLPALSGSGKSTTVMHLLDLGYRFIADDVVIVQRSKGGTVVSGFETGLFLTRRSARMLPHWAASASGGRFKKGRQWKHRVDLRAFRTTRARVRIAALVFPEITRNRETILQPLSAAQGLARCLAQRPKEYPASTLGPAALEAQFNIYAELVDSSACYRLRLGSDVAHLRATLSRI